MPRSKSNICFTVLQYLCLSHLLAVICFFFLRLVSCLQLSLTVGLFSLQYFLRGHTHPPWLHRLRAFFPARRLYLDFDRLHSVLCGLLEPSSALGSSLSLATTLTLMACFGHLCSLDSFGACCSSPSCLCVSTSLAAQPQARTQLCLSRALEARSRFCMHALPGASLTGCWYGLCDTKSRTNRTATRCTHVGASTYVMDALFTCMLRLFLLCCQDECNAVPRTLRMGT